MQLFQRQKDNYFPPVDQHGTFYRLLHHHAVAAALLLSAALLAFLCANMRNLSIGGAPIYEWYTWFWHLDAGVNIHLFQVHKPFHHWVNDGLMAIFFFVIGLEIKRQLFAGELASPRKALLPVAAAIGGLVCPAIIYALINWGGEGAHGWGIPMATDIAFAAGVLGLMRGRVPSSLAVFLVALAIVDDLGAILVIAIFYTETIATTPLLIGLGIVGLSAFFGWIGVRSVPVYFALGVVGWLYFQNSGVHATILGVLTAFTIPVSASYDTPHFAGRIRLWLDRFIAAEDHANPRLVNSVQQRMIRAIEAECIHVEAPLQRLENKLHPYSALLIMPIFAFANAGVQVDFSQAGALLLQPVTLGVIAGLVIGKQIGITAASYITVRLGLAQLPDGMNWRHVYALSWLGGIGFTMSLFISELAFSGGHAGAAHAAAETIQSPLPPSVHLAEAKIGTLVASIIAGSIGATLLYFFTRGNPPAPAHAPETTPPRRA
jgi:NhaA family Na+:H+ antiporter